MTEILPEAREAAADVLDEVSGLLQHVGIGQVADLIRDGEYDEHEVAVIVNRALLAERERQKERDAKVAEQATLPEGYNWCEDALEQFDFGKECAAQAIRSGT